MGNTTNIITQAVDGGETLNTFLARVSLDGTLLDILGFQKSNRGTPTVKMTQAGDVSAEQVNLFEDLVRDYIGRMGSLGVTPTVATVQTTNATKTEIANVAIADGETVEIVAWFRGKRASIVGFVSQTIRIVLTRLDANSGVEVLDVMEDSSPAYDSSGVLATALASIEANNTAKTADLDVTGEAGKTIDWTCNYVVRRVT